ncbi:MarR family winged helix-turn-helix transcriptional regulator [Enterococcus sp. AZ072]|uniref:MarR family winged helix-turn-helix transcriptional regulator n=1 Tax=unclassified Enterococcus TaxID=2608891 RepID=UPI003D298371
MSLFPSKYQGGSDHSVGFSFIRVYNIWHRQIKAALSQIDLTHPQFVVIASLGYLAQFDQEITQVNIADTSDIDVMTISTIIKNLEKKKLVIRALSVEDARAKSVQLTDEGTQLMMEAMKIVEEIDCRFFGQLGNEQEIFNQFLHRLSQAEVD